MSNKPDEPKFNVKDAKALDALGLSNILVPENIFDVQRRPEEKTAVNPPAPALVSTPSAPKKLIGSSASKTPPRDMVAIYLREDRYYREHPHANPGDYYTSPEWKKDRDMLMKTPEGRLLVDEAEPKKGNTIGAGDQFSGHPNAMPKANAMPEGKAPTKNESVTPAKKIIFVDSATHVGGEELGGFSPNAPGGNGGARGLT